MITDTATKITHYDEHNNKFTTVFHTCTRPEIDVELCDDFCEDLRIQGIPFDRGIIIYPHDQKDINHFYKPEVVAGTLLSYRTAHGYTEDDLFGYGQFVEDQGGPGDVYWRSGLPLVGLSLLKKFNDGGKSILKDFTPDQVKLFSETLDEQIFRIDDQGKRLSKYQFKKRLELVRAQETIKYELPRWFMGKEKIA